MGWVVYYVLRSPTPLTEADDARIKEQGREWTKKLVGVCEPYGFDPRLQLLTDDDDLTWVAEAPEQRCIRVGRTKLGFEKGKRNLVTILEALQSLRTSFPQAEILVNDDFAYRDRVSIDAIGDFRAHVALA